METLVGLAIVDVLLLIAFRAHCRWDDSSVLERDLLRQARFGANRKWDSWWATHGYRVPPARLKVR